MDLSSNNFSSLASPLQNDAMSDPYEILVETEDCQMIESDHWNSVHQ